MNNLYNSLSDPNSLLVNYGLPTAKFLGEQTGQYINNNKEQVMSSLYGYFARSGGSKPSSISKKRKYNPRSNIRFVGPMRNPLSGHKKYSGLKKELKGVDTVVNHSGITTDLTANTFSDVLAIPSQGTGSWNRIGRKIFVKYIYINLHVISVQQPEATTASLFGNLLRMVLVHDSQPSGSSTSAFSNIFQVTNQQGADSNHMLAPRKYDTMDRYKVLLDKTYSIDALQAATTGSVNNKNGIFPIKEYLKISGKNQESTFGSSSETMSIADVQSGAFILYFRAFDNTAKSYLNVGGTIRCRYTD